MTIVLLTAATHHASAQLGRATIDTLAHGIVRVRNSGPTRWAGTGGWTLVPEQAITADGTDALIAEPWSIAVDSRGDIFQTDWKVNAIQEWDRGGKFVRSIGRKGQGPGEFEVPIEIAIRNDTLLAYASNESRVSLWHTDGRLIREWRVDFCCGDAPMFGSGSTALIRIVTHHDGSDRDAAIQFRLDGTIVDTTLLLPQPAPHVWHNKRGEFPIPFWPYREGTFNSRGGYISGDANSYTLTIGRAGSDTARLIELPGSRTRVDDAYVDSVFASYARSPMLAGIPKRSDIPGVQPYFTKLYADEHDNIWIQRPDGRGQLGGFDVIDANGTFLGTVAAPRADLRAIVLRNGRLYALSDNDGEPVIRIYRIDRQGR